jgi:serine/threonine-protein kinase
VAAATETESPGEPPPAAPTREAVAAALPQFEILEWIGQGGMGCVFKARQPQLDRVVALKILPEEFGHDVKFALRFTREARTLAKLNHPNIVSVYEFGHVKDTYYFLMEFVDGSTLRDVVSAGELAPEHALAIVLRISARWGSFVSFEISVRNDPSPFVAQHTRL